MDTTDCITWIINQLHFPHELDDNGSDLRINDDPYLKHSQDAKLSLNQTFQL